ncbi:integrase core domain-containing protein [bacterium]|nr:integrase core domain-containing protein [bacterium]
MLRHQIAILQRNAKKPRLKRSDRVIFVLISKFLKSWRQALSIVKPDTVIRWHRKGFRIFWRWKSTHGISGRKPIDPAIRKLIHDMSLANHLWGAPRIHGELLKLGINVSQATVRRYMVRHRKPPSQTWKTFLENHVNELVAIDFFVVPTVTFRMLYVFIVLSHSRRNIIHFNVTQSPTAAWTGQQIIEAFPWDTAPKYLIRDNDRIYGYEFNKRLDSIGIKPVRTAFKSPCQNAYCERVIGTLRRDCTDHVIIFNEKHLKRVLRQYIEGYYNVSRTHLSLDKDWPEPRVIETPEMGKIVGIPILGGLHHRYSRNVA